MMNRFLIVALLVLVGCFAANAGKGKKLDKKDKCTRNFCTKVKGQSGKISIWKGTKEGSDSSALTLDMSHIKELDADGNEVGDNLPKDAKHSFNTFASLDFYFSDIYETTVKGAKADAFNFSATIPGPNATLFFEMFFIKENKTISLCDGSEYKMTEGTVKFNIEITGWKFCGSSGVDCGKGKKGGKAIIGEYVELETLVKAPKDKEAKDDKEGKAKGKKEKGKRLVLDDLVMKLPEAVFADGACTKMADGYPMFKQDKKKEITTLRFKKFNSKVLYDPIVEEYLSEDSDSSGSTINLSMLVACVSALVKLIA